MIKDRHLTRLIYSYPAQFKEQVNRVPPVKSAVGIEEVLNRFHDAIDHPMGKAIALALMLDQDESGERPINAAAREHAEQLFEEIFNAMVRT